MKEPNPKKEEPSTASCSIKLKFETRGDRANRLINEVVSPKYQFQQKRFRKLRLLRYAIELPLWLVACGLFVQLMVGPSDPSNSGAIYAAFVFFFLFLGMPLIHVMLNGASGRTT